MITCGSSRQLNTKDLDLVEGFNLDRYLGTWYEIARFQHRFEKDLEMVTATYELLEPGKVRVINRGYNPGKGKWEDAKGRAWVPDPSQAARLKVSFFLFFAADYRVIALDQENYSYAMVTSGSPDYLWILSRTPEMNPQLYMDLVDYARELGFDTSQLYKVKQNLQISE
ncbi:lipocalin family protein [bacterium]|nr:lipocalin family protein [bacterium]